MFLLAQYIPIKSPKGNIDAVLLYVKDITEQTLLENGYASKTSHLLHAQELAHIGNWEYFVDTNEVTASKSCYDMFGYTNSADFSIEEMQSIIHPEDLGRVTKIIEQTIRTKMEYTSEFRILHGKTGELRYIQAKAEVITKDDQPWKVLGVVQDITEHKNIVLRLADTNHTFEHIFNHLHAGFWMFDTTTNKIIFASEGLTEITQLPLDEIYSNSNFWFNFVLPQYRNELFKQYDRLHHGDMMETNYEIIDGKRNRKWIAEQTIPKVNEHGKVTHLFGMVTDITVEKEMQHRLEFQAWHDELTGLPNINSLRDTVYTLLNNPKQNPFALLYIELDDLDLIVDYLGFQAGNSVLQEIAHRFRIAIADHHYLAKIDSQSFALILPDLTSQKEAFEMAETIIETIQHEVIFENYQFYVTANIGISFYPDNGDSKLLLLENAHSALYHSKRIGKNNFQVHSYDRDISSHKQYILERDLRNAIRHEEFELYYQPQVNPISGRIIDAEALIRWNHEEWGVVSPDEFIPLAEEKHLIHLIENWVIKRVCQQLHSWKRQQLPIYPISINIAPMRFLMHSLIDTLTYAMKTYDIAPSLIKLEITESSLLQNDDAVSKKLQRLKELGISVELDDFGTGYSSFHYIQKYNLDTLKIDKMFIQNIGAEDKKDEAIISSFLHLAKGLDMKVIAEGVETHAQLKFLQQKECDIIQGYLYSKPIPSDEFEHLMKREYLQPQRVKMKITPDQERRRYFRFEFLHPVRADMQITEINKKKINIGSATVLVENISIGGIRFLSQLKLPVMRNYKMNFKIKLMGELFELDGALVYINEEKMDIFSYGVEFSTTESEKDHLAEIINKMTLLRKTNLEIPNTDFIDVNPYRFLHNT